MTQYSNFPLRAMRDTADRPNGGFVQNASLPAARHKRAAASRADPFPRGWQSRDLDSSAADIAAHARRNRSICTNVSLAALPTAALLKAARGKGPRSHVPVFNRPVISPNM